MGRIIFHSRTGEYLSCAGLRNNTIITDQFLGMLLWNIIYSPHLEVFSTLISDTHYLKNCILQKDKDYKTIVLALHTYFASIFDESICIEDKDMKAYEIVLNTAIRYGSDPIRLIARLDAQCESHLYVRGHNRAWLASIIQEGLDNNVFSTEQPVRCSVFDLVKLLNEDKYTPIITSYSVTDGVSEEPIKFDEQYERLCRENPELELTPENWTSYYFSLGWDVITVRKYIDSQVVKLKKKKGNGNSIH